MKVFIFKNRGVVVNNPTGFQEKRPDLLVKDYEDCRDIHIRDCRLRMNGDDGWTWAIRWIMGKAGDRLTTIYCPVTPKESGFTLKEILKSQAATGKRRIKEKGGRCMTVHVGRQF